jgi:PEP-CTERM motif
MKISALLTGVAMAATAAVSAHAVTFAGFVQDGNAANLSWTETGTTGGTLSASAPVYFTFDVTGLPTTPMLATLTLTGTSTDAGAVSGGDVIQGGIGGTFSITSAVPVDGTTNLLSGTFSGAQISGPNNGTTASVQDNFATGSVTYATGLAAKDLTFGADTSGNGFSFSGTSLTVLALKGNSPASFNGVFAGNFEATSAGPGGSGGVPEPATWAMMLVGAGAVGGVLRRSRRTAMAVA